MADNALKIEYKLYLEAEDVSQSRILSSEMCIRDRHYTEQKELLFLAC